jgi:hypothetical protein
MVRIFKRADAFSYSTIKQAAAPSLYFSYLHMLLLFAIIMATADPWSAEFDLIAAQAAPLHAQSDDDDQDPWMLEFEAALLLPQPEPQQPQPQQPHLHSNPQRGNAFLGRRGRGRPKGTPGNPAQRRQLQNQSIPDNFDVLEYRQSDQQLALFRNKAHVHVPDFSSLGSIQHFQQILRPIGNGALANLTTLLKIVRDSSLRQTFAHVAAPDPNSLFEYVLGSLERPCTTLASEAASLNVNPEHFSLQIKRLGGIAYFGDRVWMSSMLSHIQARQYESNFKILCTFRYWKYDETPMMMRSDETSISSSARICHDAASAIGDTDTSLPIVALRTTCSDLNIVPSLSESKVSKIFSTKLTYGILLKTSRGYTSLEIPMSTALLQADTSTGETICQIISLNKDLQLWPCFVQRSQHAFEISTTDSASSNIRFERYEDLAEQGLKRLRKPCEVHFLSRVAFTVYVPIANIISGMQACVLSMKQGGATYKARECLMTCLLGGVKILPSEPPGPSDPRHVYIKRVLDLSLDPKRLRDRQRRIVLEANLTGDWQQWDIQWHTRLPNPHGLNFAAYHSR